MERAEERNAESERRIGRSLSLKHAALMLGVSRRTIYNSIRRSHLQATRTTGGSPRVLLESFGFVASLSGDVPRQPERV